MPTFQTCFYIRLLLTIQYMTIYDISTKKNIFFLFVLHSKNFLLSNGNKNFSNSSIIDLLYSYAKDIRELFGRSGNGIYFGDVMSYFTYIHHSVFSG